jgi:NAD(P)-dependent dehydrogenase (short-subunit alcohol dehydrogenase family)
LGDLGIFGINFRTIQPNMKGNDASNKVCVVTGGNSGVGLMTALGLAKAGYHVFIACRSATKAAKATHYIRRHSGNEKVEFLPLDLASLESVRQFVQLFNEKNLPLDRLVNNAGIFHKRGKTQEGFELIWGTNYLGHFLLTYLLLDKLKQSEQSRVVMVASDLALQAESIRWNLLFKETPINFLELYSISKFCLLLLTFELARRLNNHPVTINAVHPGFVRSNITIGHRLSKYLGLGISPEEGAYSTLFCATSAEVEGVSGKFFNSQAQEFTIPQLAKDMELAKELWQKSLAWTGSDHENSHVSINYNQYNGFVTQSRLSLADREIEEITQTIFKEVLPKPPNQFSSLNLLKLLVKGNLGSAFLLLFQRFKREFHMERHLDSPAVRKLCQDEKLLEKLREYLGEEVVLWRSELWVNYPAQQLIPFWHQDCYPKLLTKTGKTINVYIALTEVNQFNGFEFIDTGVIPTDLSVKAIDPFSGNPFFRIPAELEKKAISIVLKPGEFVLFTDELVHRSVCNTSGKVRLSLTLRVTQPGVEVSPSYSPQAPKPMLL